MGIDKTNLKIHLFTISLLTVALCDTNKYYLNLTEFLQILLN